MANYDLDDEVTYYFVVDKDADGIGRREIVGWTDNKVLATYYKEMHGRKSLIIRKVSQAWNQIVKILNQYPNDGISIANVRIRKENSGIRKNVNDMTETIGVPLTTAELGHIQDMVATHCSSMVGYAQIYDIIPMLKKKYIRAFSALGLMDIIHREIHNAEDAPFADGIVMDEIMLLIKFFEKSFE